MPQLWSPVTSRHFRYRRVFCGPVLCTKPAKAMVGSRKRRKTKRGADVPRDLKGVSVDQILLHDYWCDITLMAQYYGVLGSPQSAFEGL